MAEPGYQDKCFVCGKIVVLSFLSDENYPMHEECARDLLPRLLRSGKELVDNCDKLFAEMKRSNSDALNKAVAEHVRKFEQMKREGTL